MKLPRPVSAVVFDMDGLLIDSERVVRDAMLAIARHHGVELPEAVFLTMIGATHEASRAIARRHFGDSFDLDAYDEAVEREVVAELQRGDKLKAGAAELIGFLEALGVPRAVATSSSHEAVRRSLGRAAVLDRFQTVVARGDYARGKPAPDPYLEAARRLGVAPADCLALEDSHNGVRAAHAAGMMTVMVPDLLAPTAEIAALTVAVVPSLHGILDLWPTA